MTPSLRDLAVESDFLAELHIMQQVADRQIHRQLAVDLAVESAFQTELHIMQ